MGKTECFKHTRRLNPVTNGETGNFQIQPGSLLGAFSTSCWAHQSASQECSVTPYPPRPFSVPRLPSSAPSFPLHPSSMPCCQTMPVLRKPPHKQVSDCNKAALLCTASPLVSQAGRFTCAAQTVKNCLEQNTVQSSGDSRGNGVRQAAWGIFHLRLQEVGCKVRTGQAQGRLKGSLVLPAICHLSDVTRFIWAAHFKGPLLVLAPSLPSPLSLFWF